MSIPDISKLVSGEIFPVFKPLNWTSFDVVKKLRNLISKASHQRKIKIGHAGTLDPLASGVLVIATGLCTKQLPAIQEMEKEYSGIITFGATTPSFDLETKIDQTFSISHISEKDIYETARQMIGKIQQAPPIYSAKMVEGKRAYMLARKGQAMEMKKELITLYEFEITQVLMPEVHFRAVCSKGTYIRALARDFGSRLQSGAHLSKLCRTRIGEYNLQNTITISQFEYHCRYIYANNLLKVN